MRTDLRSTVNFIIIIILLGLFHAVPSASVFDVQEFQKIHSQADTFEEDNKIQKEKMPHRKRHLVFLCTLLHDVEQYMLCVLHFVDVRSTVLHICSLGQYFQNLFLWSLGSCTCSLNNYLHLSIISLLAPQDEKYSRKIPLEIYIFQKLCGIALFLLNKLETDSFKDIREGRKSNELNWVNYLIIK